MLPFDSSLSLLAPAAFLAGFVDAVVGGGGLVQLPALLAFQPGVAPAALLGTNKSANVFGTASAAVHYLRRVDLPWRTLGWAALAAFCASYLGAAAVAWLPARYLKPLILLLLVGSAIYTFIRKDFGAVHRPRHAGRKEMVLALGLGAVIGFYDGFLGPGTGSFLIFLFIRFFGFDFLHASAAAKVVNGVTNLAALAFFLPHGHVLPLLALVMAACNVAGAQAGTHLALRKGSAFVRQVFLAVVSALILRLAWEVFMA